jgi:hypothetical protein
MNHITRAETESKVIHAAGMTTRRSGGRSSTIEASLEVEDKVALVVDSRNEGRINFYHKIELIILYTRRIF